jgi:hypothetical protein
MFGKDRIAYDVEQLSILAALEELPRICDGSTAAGRRVAIHTDCQGILLELANPKSRGSRISTLRRSICRHIANGYSIVLRWIPRGENMEAHKVAATCNRDPGSAMPHGSYSSEELCRIARKGREQPHNPNVIFHRTTSKGFWASSKSAEETIAAARVESPFVADIMGASICNSCRGAYPDHAHLMRCISMRAQIARQYKHGL